MSRLRDDIDQLTARMTTPAVNAVVDSDIETPRPEILVLLMGHLPVRAGLWRLPAVSHLFPESESIIVARQEDGDLFLDCLGMSMGSLGDPAGSALDRLPQDSKVVIVPDSNVAPDVLAEMAPDRVAIVTGGDQAAIVGAYSQLKNLTIDQDMTIELIIAGSSPETVGDTATRLIDAASRHLKRKIRFTGAIAKIEADTVQSSSYSVPAHEGGLLELTRRVRRGPTMERILGVDPTGRRVVSTGPMVDSIPVASFTPSMFDPDSMVDEPVVAELESDCNRLLPLQPTVSASSPERPATIEPQPKSSFQVDIEPVATAVEEVSGTSVLLSWHIPGLRTLPVHCPMCKSMELAMDDSGDLHLLARDSDVSSIPAVQKWIREHHHLLQMAMPGARFEHHESIPIHVLGQDVDVLCGLRGTGWHPHLLVRVDHANPEGWAQVSLEN